MNPLTTGLVLLACAVLLACLGALARIKREQIAKWEHAYKSFYRHAAQIIESDQVPDELVAFIEFLSNMSGRKSALALFTLLAVLQGRPKRNTESDIARKIAALPVRLQDSFRNAIDAFFISFGWRSLFLGWIFRLAGVGARAASGSGGGERWGGPVA